MSGAYFFMTNYYGETFYNELTNLCRDLSIPLDMGEPELQVMQDWKKPVYKAFTGGNIMIIMQALVLIQIEK